MQKILILLAIFTTYIPSFSQTERPIQSIVQAYDSTSIVAFGEKHDQIEILEFYKSLLIDKTFQERVDDIVLELGNSFYQEILDKYIDGQNVSFEEVRNVWFNATNSLLQLGNFSAVEILIKYIREINIELSVEKKFRVIAADPPVNWDEIKSPSDFWPFLGRRDLNFIKVIWEEVIDKKRNAFVIMGRRHLLRHDPKPLNYISLVDALEARLGNKIFILRVEEMEKIDSFPVFKKVENTPLTEKIVFKDYPLKYKEAIDAVLYLGPLHPMLIEPFTDKKDIEKLNKRSLILNNSKFQFNSYDYLFYLINKEGAKGVAIFIDLVKSKNSLIDYNEQLVNMVANDTKDVSIKLKILQMIKELSNSKN